MFELLAIAIMVIATVGDLWSTDHALYRGMVERNPFVRKQMELADRLGTHWFNVNGAVSVVATLILLSLGWQALMIMAVGRLGVVGWNLRLIWKHENK